MIGGAKLIVQLQKGRESFWVMDQEKLKTPISAYVPTTSSVLTKNFTLSIKAVQ